MEYIFREKFIRPGLKEQIVLPKVVLIAEPDHILAEIYSRHFTKADFIADKCVEYGKLLGHLSELDPHLLLLSLGPIKSQEKNVIKNISKRHPSMQIITTADKKGSQDLTQLLGLGVAGHINKALTRPRDIVTLAQHVLECR